MVQQNLGVLAEMQGRTDEALAHLRLALNAFEQAQERTAVLWVLNNIGMLYTREGAYPRAADALDDALELARMAGDTATEGIVEENRATLFLAIGKFDAAHASATRAYKLADQRHDNTRRAAALRQLARVARVRQQPAAESIATLQRALSLCELGEDAELRAEILSDLGDACRDAGDITRAKDCWRRALDVARIAGFSAMVIGLQARLRPGALDRSASVSEAAR
jgi:tetratricopeptide (TPR) repeat protein